jgi:hypothetical protein
MGQLYQMCWHHLTSFQALAEALSKNQQMKFLDLTGNFLQVRGLFI